MRQNILLIILITNHLSIGLIGPTLYCWRCWKIIWKDIWIDAFTEQSTLPFFIPMFLAKKLKVHLKPGLLIISKFFIDNIVLCGAHHDYVSPIQALFLYAHKTDWLNVGHIIFETMRTSPILIFDPGTSSSSKTSKTSLPYGMLLIVIFHLFEVPLHNLIVCCQFIERGFVKLMRLSTPDSFPTPDSASVLCSSSSPLGSFRCSFVVTSLFRRWCSWSSKFWSFLLRLRRSPWPYCHLLGFDSHLDGYRYHFCQFFWSSTRSDLLGPQYAWCRGFFFSGQEMLFSQPFMHGFLIVK